MRLLTKILFQLGIEIIVLVYVGKSLYIYKLLGRVCVYEKFNYWEVFVCGGWRVLFQRGECFFFFFLE